MLLQIVQLLIVSYVASHGEGRKADTRRISKYHSIIHQHHLRKEKDSTPSFVRSDKNIGKDEVISSIGRNNPEKNRVPKSKPQLEEKQKNAHGIHLRSMVGYSGTSGNLFGETRDVSEKNYGHSSWNHFIYKMNAASETLNYPVKTQEVQREVCKTLPFTQNITHENCDTAIIQNNLCFGKCNSLYVPNQKEQFNIYSQCLPFKFTMNHLKLNCTGSINVVKVIMMVEECKCVVRNSLGVNNNKVTSFFGHH
ncbi:cerberus [Dendropsophus ebraccatus]|uniref:cerberus n=1 Tax=Dendropsophus ebraccatus TaxID=150705 RepID=UPI0038318237